MFKCCGYGMMLPSCPNFFGPLALSEFSGSTPAMLDKRKCTSQFNKRSSLSIPLLPPNQFLLYKCGAELAFTNGWICCGKRGSIVLLRIYLYITCSFCSFVRYNVVSVLGGLAAKDTRTSLSKVRKALCCTLTCYNFFI